ncbi:hypothetical protein Barb4_02494 [Bacteroidales bacterium Barb4]|nr:hypothetical protein Barb4_02494 [Bacteroidales bacterium Barb4]
MTTLFFEQGDAVGIVQGKGLRLAFVLTHSIPSVGKGKGVDAAAEGCTGKGEYDALQGCIVGK